MSDQGMSGHCEVTTEFEDDSPEKPARAKPFTHLELVDVVEYMERKSYAQATSGQCYRRKIYILSKLSRKLLRKHGIFRTPRQIQKRYSDLKVRQEELLKQIRKEIQEREDPESLCQTSDVPNTEEIEKTTFEDLEQNQPEPNQTEEQEESFTLHLEPVECVENFESLQDAVPQAQQTGDVHDFIGQIQCIKEAVKMLDSKLDTLLNTVKNFV